MIPDDSLSLSDGAIKPFRSGYSMECQEDLMRFGRRRGMDLDTPYLNANSTDLFEYPETHGFAL